VDLRNRLGLARVGHLATVTAGGTPHVVPCCFALHDETIYSAIDAKPKTTLALQRLANIEVNPRASLAVDHYEEDWTKLWWVRADGDARVVDDEAERGRALSLLAGKYEQYRSEPPPGPVLAIDVTRWSGWSFAGTST
jgi:PPOX class probable F420-dependent enzyme